MNKVGQEAERQMVGAAGAVYDRRATRDDPAYRELRLRDELLREVPSPRMT